MAGLNKTGFCSSIQTQLVLHNFPSEWVSHNYKNKAKNSRSSPAEKSDKSKCLLTSYHGENCENNFF